MNTLKYSLEYQCYPIWNYNQDGELVDNDLPDELRADTELDSLLLRLQELFNALFVDTPREFSTHGFSTEVKRQEFLTLLFTSKNLLYQRYGSKYHIECKYTMDSFPLDREG